MAGFINVGGFIDTSELTTKLTEIENKVRSGDMSKEEGIAATSETLKEANEAFEQAQRETGKN